MKNNTETLRRILTLLGINAETYMQAYQPETLSEILSLRCAIAEQRHNYAGSPLHRCARMTNASPHIADRLRTVNVNIVEDMCLQADFVHPDFRAIVLPKHKDSKRVASVLNALMSYRMFGTDSDATPCCLIEYSRRSKQFTVSAIEKVDAERCEAVFNAFVTAICTNEELDFDVEMEICELRSKSRHNRERIRRRMKELGVSVLRGRKADVYLRKGARKGRIDLALLRSKYPDAYSECCSGYQTTEYITVKLHE